MEQLTSSFAAKGDDGQDYTIHVYETPIPPSQTVEGPSGPDTGTPTRRFVTTTGLKLNWREKGCYQVQGALTVLVSDDPLAP
jgi:hypothetical protein